MFMGEAEVPAIIDEDGTKHHFDSDMHHRAISSGLGQKLRGKTVRVSVQNPTLRPGVPRRNVTLFGRYWRLGEELTGTVLLVEEEAHLLISAHAAVPAEEAAE